VTGLFRSSREDGRADWRVVFDRLNQMRSGDVVTHVHLRDLLGTEDNARMYRAVQRAKAELWSSRQTSIDSIRGVGYRMLAASEMERQAMQYKRRSRKQLGNAVSVVQATDLDQLTSEERGLTLRTRGVLLALAQAMDETMVKVADHEERLRKLEAGQ